MKLNTGTMKKVLLSMTMLFLGTIILFGQIEATTKDGKKVLLNDDGTWKYIEAEPKKDLSSSLQCSDLVSEKTDKVTGKTSRSSTSGIAVTKDNKKGLVIRAIQAERKSIILAVSVVGAGACIDDKNQMNVLFRDGTRLELVNNGKFNCEGNFTLYFGDVFGKKKEMEMFGTKEIETMRVWTSKGYVEEDFTPENSKAFMLTFHCLMN